MRDPSLALDWHLMWLLALLVGLVIGFIGGKIAAVRRFQNWLTSLSEWDQVTVRTLLRDGGHSEEEYEFQQRMNKMQAKP